MRIDNRKNDEIRKCIIEPDYIIHPTGSCLISLGNTKVICSAMVDKEVPKWLEGKGKGWLTSEYSLLPYSTHDRNQRESSKGKIGGRTYEIQRLIGRALRGIIDLKKLGERTIWIDCDVIQADGGTRTAAITGSFVALSLAIKKLLKDGLIKENPILHNLAAISVGLKNKAVILDLNYEEDSSCDVDMNIVMTGNNEFIEVQGTAENKPFTSEQLYEMLNIAKNGIHNLFNIQNEIIK
ncbi:MAG: ribonuclease PH [Pseudomonadota bacterium]